MTGFFTLLAVALAPTIYLAIVIYGRDKYDREPKRILLIAFLLGCLSTIPALILEALWESNGFGISESLVLTAFHAIVVVGFSEEISKFIMLRFHAFRLKEFNEPFDGIVYGAFIALGFATVENLFYVFEEGIGVGILRMFTSVPAHYAFGVIMGYYVGLAKFIPERRTELLIRGVLYATVLHGAFDFFVLQETYPGLVIFTLIVFVYSWRMSKKAIRELQTDSRFRFKDKNIT